MINKTKLEELEALFNRIDISKADDYKQWFEIGAACFHSNEDSFYIWEAWSAYSNKYTREACLAKWENFKNNPVENPRTIGTLICYANLDNANNNIDYTKYKDSVFNVSDNTPAEEQAKCFFNALFADSKSDDYICITADVAKPRFIKKNDVIHYIDEHINLNKENGVYICINPLKENRRKSEKVSSYKHLLIEFDDISLEEQKKILEEEKLPASTVTFSGKKSLHLLFKLNASSYNDYKNKANEVYEYLTLKGYKFDSGVKDPVRFTRFAGFKRNGIIQSLLSVNSGKYSSYDEWKQQKKINTVKENKPTQYINFLDCLSYDANEAYDKGDVLLGNKYLYRGGALLINAYSGAGKSTLAIQMALQLACGKSLIGGIPVHKACKVVIFQAENDSDEIKCNVKSIFENGVRNGDFKYSDKEQIQNNLCLLPESEFARGQAFLDKLRQEIDLKKPDIVILDPVLHCFDGSIKDQEAVSAFFRNGLQPILAKTKTASILIHHRNKPSKDENALPFDAQNYTGTGSSELTNWVRAIINLNRYKDSFDLFYLSLAKRGEKAGNGGKHNIFIQRSNNPNEPYWYEVPPPENTSVKSTTSKYDNKGYNFLPVLSAQAFKELILTKENCTEKQYRSYVRSSVIANRVIYDPICKTYKGKDFEKGKFILDKVEELTNKGLNATNCLAKEDKDIYNLLVENNITLN